MEKQFKGAVIFDYDGTLTDRESGLHIPSAKTVEAISRLKINGYAACLATGRSLKYIPYTGIDFDMLITANGGCTIYKNRIIGEKPFDKSTLLSLTEYFDRHNMIYVLENYSHCYVNLPDDTLFKEMIGMFAVKHSVFTPVEHYRGESIYKIMLIYRSHNDFAPFKEAFGSLTDITLPNADITSCDINPKGVSKADGLHDVCRHFCIEKNNTFAFGDGENDFTMLKSAGHGIAMQNHSPCLDSAAEFITGPSSGDGIYQGLIHYNLIDEF
ncbi:Cof-type HAD-IIB family hydrolase [Lachnospiraceae bacterium NSJ-143]|nr:Cof-type HAD-IIB family hydrolase [Lachnospiraceae bacterium NSJ-143]